MLRWTRALILDSYPHRGRLLGMALSVVLITGLLLLKLRPEGGPSASRHSSRPWPTAPRVSAAAEGTEGRSSAKEVHSQPTRENVPPGSATTWELVGLAGEPKGLNFGEQSVGLTSYRVFPVGLSDEGQVGEPYLQSVLADTVQLSVSLRLARLALVAAESLSSGGPQQPSVQGNLQWCVHFVDKDRHSGFLKTRFKYPETSIEHGGWSPGGVFSYVATEQPGGFMRSYLHLVSLALDSKGSYVLQERSVEREPVWVITHPAWNPAKEVIAYTVALTEVKHEIRVWNGRQLAVLDDGLLPTWSTDGEMLAFVEDRGGDEKSEPFEQALRVCKADGSDSRRLLVRRNTLLAPVCFIPHPYRIVFTEKRERYLDYPPGQEPHNLPPEQWEVYEANLASGRVQHLFASKSNGAGMAVVGPDGQQLGFSGYRSDATRNTIARLGFHQRTVELVASIPLTWGRVSKRVRWTPDGSALVTLVSSPEDHRTLCYVPLKGEPRLLAPAEDFGFW